jgi:DNA-binding transcriptional ArsR family regulator
MSITRLAAGSSVTRQAVTKHLHVMEKAGLVHGTRRGRERIWQLNPRRIEKAQRDLEQISKRWDEALGRLRTIVENERA